MSKANVDIVRRQLEAYLAGDNEAALADYDPEVEFDTSAGRVDGRVYRGREGVAEGMREWTGTWNDFKVEVQDIVDAGDRVLLVVRESGRGKGSGIELDRVLYVAFTLRDRKIVRWKGFVDRKEALEAAGISA